MEGKNKSKSPDKNHLITKWSIMDEWAKKEKDRELKLHIDRLIENAKVALEQNQNYKSDYSNQTDVISGMANPSGQCSQCSSDYNNYTNQDVKVNDLSAQSLLMHADHAETALNNISAISNPQANNSMSNGLVNNPQISIEIDTHTLAADLKKKKAGLLEKPKQIEEIIGQAAARIAQDIGANCVTSIERKGIDIVDRDHLIVQVSIFRKFGEGNFKKVEYQTKMRKVMSGSVVPIKELLMEAVNKKYISKGDRIVCVEDESLGMGYKGLLFIFDVDKIFFNISNLNLASNISAEVLEATINIAIEISKEGREGKKIGTAFIIGAKEELDKYTKQMIMNPFSGYPEEYRKITELNMNGTIKEFAQLDGVFVIDQSGLILSAGTYINVDASSIELPGYGTRHRCSAAITKACSAIAVVVSESGGIISIFKNGKLVVKLP